MMIPIPDCMAWMDRMAASVWECLPQVKANRTGEDVDQDDTYVYIGDFGNNSSGNRQDLHILSSGKGLLPVGHRRSTRSWFQHEDQLISAPGQQYHGF